MATKQFRGDVYTGNVRYAVQPSPRRTRFGVCSHCQTGGIGLVTSVTLENHRILNGETGPICAGSGSEPEMTHS